MPINMTIRPGLKLSTSVTLLLFADSSQAMVISCLDLYVLLGCSLPIQSLSSVCNVRLQDRFHHILISRYVCKHMPVWQQS